MVNALAAPDRRSDRGRIPDVARNAFDIEAVNGLWFYIRLKQDANGMPVIEQPPDEIRAQMPRSSGD
jgi:hypothetical protein